MGAWGVGVLENDHALDIMDGGIIEDKISFLTVKLLLSSQYEEERILGASIVTASMEDIGSWVLGNGRFIKWFSELKDYKKELAPLVREAYNQVCYSLEKEINHWKDKPARRKVLRYLQDRLEEHVDKV